MRQSNDEWMVKFFAVTFHGLFGVRLAHRAWFVSFSFGFRRSHDGRFCHIRGGTSFAVVRICFFDDEHFMRLYIVRTAEKKRQGSCDNEHPYSKKEFHSNSCEPIIALVFPVAPRFLVCDDNLIDPLCTLVSEFCRHHNTNGRPVFYR